MAKLITNHDPFHIHKILGVCALLNYVYRFYLLFTIGTLFPNDESKSISVLSVLLHALLSLSSLLLPLPAKRNFSSPMIWPEFRLHSITFATRHAIITVLNLLNVLPDNLWINIGCRLLVILATIKIASIITDKYGCRVKRTTNAMPYPKYMTDEKQKPVKKFYMLSQFGATACCLLEDPSATFIPIFAIQIAPLMMTFVRKGKASSASLHRVYALSLYLAYVTIIVRCLTEDRDFGFRTVFILSFPASKIRRKLEAKYVWCIVSFVLAIYPMTIAPIIKNHIPEKIFHKLLMVGMCLRFWNISNLFILENLSLSLTVGRNKSDTGKKL